MEINRYFNSNNVIIEDKERSKKNTLEYLTGIASKRYDLNKQYLFSKIMDREKKLTTGIGGRLATPHARLKNIDRCYVILLVNKNGIEFEAMDNKKVYVVALILSPTNKVRTHIALMSKLSYLLTENKNIDNLINSNSPEEVIEKISS